MAEKMVGNQAVKQADCLADLKDFWSGGQLVEWKEIQMVDKQVELQALQLVVAMGLQTDTMKVDCLAFYLAANQVCNLGCAMVAHLDMMKAAQQDKMLVADWV